MIHQVAVAAIVLYGVAAIALDISDPLPCDDWRIRVIVFVCGPYDATRGFVKGFRIGRRMRKQGYSMQQIQEEVQRQIGER